MPILDATRRLGPFLLVFCVAVWLWTVAESFAISTRLGRAGPDLWPKMVLLLMVGAALWGMAEALFKRRPEDQTSILIANAAKAAGHEKDARQDLVADAGDPAQRKPLFSIAGIAAMLSYVAVIHYLGYAVSTFLLLLSIMLVAGYRRPVLAVVISLLGAIAFFVVFQRIVYISLPLGLGPFKELSLMLMAIVGVR
jgi:putative tricarboxylic transport membrane protein